MLDTSQKVNKQKKKRLNQKKIKAGSLPRIQNKKPSQNNKKFLKNIPASGFKYITKKYLYMYMNNYINIHI